MDDNNLLMIILAFIVGFMLQGMMKNMCGGQLVEGINALDALPGVAAVDFLVHGIETLAENDRAKKVKEYNELFNWNCEQKCKGTSRTCKTGDPDQYGYNLSCSQSGNNMPIRTQWWDPPYI